MATAGSAGTLAGIRTGTPGGCRSARSSPHRPGQLPVPVPAAAPSRRADTAPRPSALTLTRAFLPFGFTFEAPSFLSGIIVGLAVRFSVAGKALVGVCGRCGSAGVKDAGLPCFLPGPDRGEPVRWP